MNFDDIIKEMEAFQRKVMGSMLGDLEKTFGDSELRRLDPFEGFEESFRDIEKSFESKAPQGEWSFERIDRPGVKGFIARGMFTGPDSLKRPEEILPPLRPEPGEPRKPLYDVQPEEGQLRVYFELPGVSEEDINLEVMEGMLRLHAGDFEEEIDLSRWIIDPDKMTKSYGNGVLEVTIPKEDLKEQMV